jgi:hypothetical protein
MMRTDDSSVIALLLVFLGMVSAFPFCDGSTQKDSGVEDDDAAVGWGLARSRILLVLR